MSLILPWPTGRGPVDEMSYTLAMRPDLIPGARLDDLTISDHRGEPVTLSKLAGGFPLILSFYRGYW
jgi:hypothetical protein